MTDTAQQLCVKCGLIVDARGVNGARPTYCRCRCVWPVHGCGAPIYFLVNANENVQPFDYNGVPHHATCPAFKKWKEDAKRNQRPAGVSQLETFLK